MKKLNTIVLFVIALLFFSCSTDKDELTKEELVNYLKTRNSNYIFHNDILLENAKSTTAEPIYFNSIQEMDNFLNAIDAIKGEQNSDMFIMTEDIEDYSGTGTGSTYYKETRYIGGFGVYMNIGFNVNNCQASNLNSWLSGFTLGISYNHLGGSLNKYPNKIYYNAHGILNYNIFVEGIGTVFSENVSYAGQYQCN